LKIYRFQPTVRALIFDIDMTLYENREFYKHQQAAQLSLLEQSLGIKTSRIHQEVEDFRKNNPQSLGNTLKALYNISIQESVQLRIQAIRPEDFLTPDPFLQLALDQLQEGFQIAALTNNPVAVGRRILRTLGVEDYFPILVGLDSTMTSKPDKAPYQAILKALNRPREECCSIGDRYHVDLAYPLEHQWGGAVLVEGIDDVYKLPQRINKYEN